MRYNFIKFGATSNLELDKSRKDYFFFEQNKEKFAQIFEFLSGQKSFFVLSGFQGVGKSKIIDEALSYLNSNVLFFKYRMYQATTLDDLLMNLMIDFREYQKNNRTTLPKVDSKDFRVRIQQYVKTIEKPMLLVLEAYSDILSNEENASGINEFLFQLASTDKFKIIFVSRTFDTELLTEHNLNYDKMIINSASKEGLKEYILQSKISATDESIEKLLDATHCYLKYIDLTIKLLLTLNISLDDLMNEHEQKNINFSIFLINKLTSLIPENSKELVYFLALSRLGVSEKFLVSLSKKNATKLAYLKNIKILNEDNKKNLYIKDYFKKELIKELDQYLNQKLHRLWADTFSRMLPKKPFERELPISRSTMRQERDYHAKFVSNYTPPSDFAKYAQPTKPQQVQVEIEEEPSIPIIIEPQQPETAHITPTQIQQTTENQNIDEVLQLAKKCEKDFDFQNAILYYQTALGKQNEQSFAEKKPLLLRHIANCYSKLRKPQNAIACYELAYEIYNSANDNAKAYEMIFEIANAYKHEYKFLVAKSYLEKILNAPEEPNAEILSKTYTLLADMEDLTSNILEAKSLYKKALQYALFTTNKALISEAFFKFGLLLDDTNQQSFAIDCYKKCIETCKNPNINSYLSSAYSNLAGLYAESKDIKSAVEYYNKALEADKITQNHEGLYFVYTKLSGLYTAKEPQKSYQYLVKALKSAKKINDSIYTASAYMEIGDYYYRQKNYPKALKSYLNTKHFLSANSDEDNKIQIDTRIKELKLRLDSQLYNQIIKNFEYKDET